MLINNVNGEAVAASMVRDAEFYIDIAIFVQAYNIIVKNPNEFLTEIGEPTINEKKEKISWAQFVKIIQKCDFGFKTTPTDTDLLVFYNYAIEIGSLDSVKQKLATVSEVADAQKHYYNFVDQAKDRAETEYNKQHKLYLSRENEMKNADNELSGLKAVSVFAYIMMLFSVFVGIMGIVSLFAANIIADTVGSFVGPENAHYAGGAIFIIVGLLMFFLFNKLYENFNRKHFKLKKATETIFSRGNESYVQEVSLRRKLDVLTRELKTVQTQLNDKHKRFDVKENISKLKATNKYYQKFIENDEEFVAEAGPRTDDEKNLRVEDFAPVKLTKEQEENLRRVGKEAITLEGQIDLDAYKEKFEKSRSEKQETQEDSKENDNAFEVDAQKQAELQEQQKQAELKAQEQELMSSIDYIKGILGFNEDENLEKGK